MCIIRDAPEYLANRFLVAACQFFFMKEERTMFDMDDHDRQGFYIWAKKVQLAFALKMLLLIHLEVQTSPSPSWPKQFSHN
jgi:hypothetical protein